jgi:hypothetical protein
LSRVPRGGQEESRRRSTLIERRLGLEVSPEYDRDLAIGVQLGRSVVGAYTEPAGRHVLDVR